MPPIDRVRAEVARVVALGRSLDATDWSQPSRCEGWSVADVFGHLANDFERFDAWLTDSLAGTLDPPFEPDEFRGDNAAMLERFAGVPGPERLHALERDAARWLMRVELLDPQTPQRHPRGTITIATQMLFAAGECALHGWDVATALGREWSAPASAGEIADAYRHVVPIDDDEDPWTELLAASGRRG